MRFNGKDFADFGVFVDESKAFGSPEKDYELVEIMGRNGNLSIYNDRFKDITLPFPCFIRTGFIEKYRSLLAYLNSQTGYQRLETDKEPNHFRKALFQGIVDPQTTAFNHGGFFTVNFFAHPQRYLKSGEIPVSASSQSVSYDGNPVEIDNPSGISAVSSLAVALNPIQNLNGYDSPWVGGAGKNKLPTPYGDGASKTTNGITYTVNADGSVTANGTATANNVFYLVSASASALANKGIASGTYVLSGAPSTSTSSNYYIQAQINGDTWVTATASGATINYNATAGGNDLIRLYVVSGAVLNNVTFKPMLRLASVTDATYEPYANVCPIYPANGKNILNIPNMDTTFGALTVKSNNGVCIANGTATSGTTCKLLRMTGTLPAGEYILNGNANFTQQIVLQVYSYTRSSNIARCLSNADVTFTVNANEDIVVVLYVFSGQTLNNFTFYPMIRPVSITDSSYQPYQGIMVERCGKNLFTDNAEDLESGSIDGSTGNPTSNANRVRYSHMIPFPLDNLVDAGYHLAVPTGYDFAIRYYDANGNFIYKGTAYTGFGNSLFTNAFYGQGVKYVKIVYRKSDNSNITPSDINHVGFSCTFGTEATEYEPFVSNSYPYSLGQSVYGGTVDLATGVLTVDKGYITVGDCTWTYNSSNHTFLTTGAIGKMAGYLTVQSDRYTPTNAALADMANGTIRGHATNATSVYIKDERYTDAGTFKTAQADAQIVYELATPLTYNLTPQQISLLTGVNYISSSDEVTVVVTEPSLLENPTLFESKPLIRVYGNGVLTVNNQYITVAENPYEYIDIDCDMMDCSYGSNNANQYVTFSTSDYITLKSGNNYIAYDGTVKITPRWYEV